MKIISLVFLITAYVSAQSQDELMGLEGLVNIIEIKCKRKSGETAMGELERSFSEASTCIRRVDPNIYTNGFLKDCDALSNSSIFSECIPPIVEKLKVCLEEEESFLPDFLYSAFNHTLIEFCGSTGEAKLDYIREILLNKTGNLEDFLVLVGKRCFPVLAVFNSANHLEGTTFIAKESEICSDLLNFRTCLTNMLNEKSNTDHAKFVHYLMEPYLNWCAQHA